MTVAGTIEIEAHAPAWLSLLLFARWRSLSIEIDGELGHPRWGTHRFVVAPGTHDVRVGLEFTAKARATVDVAANETVRLRYTPAWIKDIPGSLEIARVPTARATR